MGVSARAHAVLRQRGASEPVEFGIVLGTGLGTLAAAVEDPVSITYADLPGFPATGVSGHGGRLVIGRWAGARVALLQGRAHYYEAGDPAVMTVPLETLALLGAKSLVLTNSAGSIRPDWPPGSVVLLSDHINLSGLNPLIGVADDRRFVSLADTYDAGLRARMRRAATAAGLGDLSEGVYMWFPGPSFETAAEIRAARTLGADLVGMSTVPEAILARHIGLSVVAISMVTNFATGVSGGNPSHGETKSVALGGSAGLEALLTAFLRPDA